MSRFARHVFNQGLKTQLPKPKIWNVGLSSSLVKIHDSGNAKTGPLALASFCGPQIRCCSAKPEIHSRIESLVTGKPLVVFMKGQPLFMGVV